MRSLQKSAPFSKHVHLKQNTLECPRTIVTDARDVYDKVSTEKAGLPTGRFDAGNSHHGRMVGQLSCSGTLDRTRKHDHERSDERPQRVTATLGSRIAKRRMQCTKRRYVDSRKIRVSVETHTKDEFNTCKSWRIG